MKKLIIFTFSFTITLHSVLYSQDEVHSGEFIFQNLSNYNRQITIRVYPVSIVFNGDRNNGYRYDLRAINFLEDELFEYHFINGRNTGNLEFILSPGSYLISFNHDHSTSNGGTHACVGYGIYKAEVHWNGGMDTFTVEWDAGYPWPEQGWAHDLTITFRDDGNNPRLYYAWTGAQERLISQDGKKIYAWDQKNGRLRLKIYGNFIWDNANSNNYFIFPQDSRRDCGGENQVFEDNRSGLLTLNLTIDKNVNTPTTGLRLDYPITHITVLQGSKLTINSERTLTILSTYNEDSFYTYLNNYGTIHLKPGRAKILIENRNYFNLYSGSLLKIEQISEVRIKPYGKLCNYGGRISNSGRIIFEGGRDRCPGWQDFIIDDSTQIILEDSASWELEAGSTITLEGEVTCLRMKPGSQIKFGENSKLILKNGAHIIADNATFTSLNAGETWDGIYLEDV